MRQKGKRANEANTSSFECTPKSWERLTRNYKYLRKIAFISSGSGLWWFEWELPPTRSLVFEPLIPSWWWSLGRLRTHGLKVCSFSICFPCFVFVFEDFCARLPRSSNMFAGSPFAALLPSPTRMNSYPSGMLGPNKCSFCKLFLALVFHHRNRKVASRRFKVDNIL